MSPDTEKLVEVRGLSKTYSRGPELVQALANVSFRLDPGELVSLVGRSGSGKTTLLNILAGWDTPDAGEVLWAPLMELNAQDRLPWSEIGLLPQGLGLVDDLSIRENVELPLRVTARRRMRGTDSRVEALLRALGVQHLADRGPSEVSLGEQQRAALARALVMRPRLVLADEPTGHQDEAWSRGVIRLLRYAADRGICCVLATHDERAVRRADRVLAMADGHLEEKPVDVSRLRVRS
jgi:ABC-type lipoprotein export system ATPase subunit